jgi:succinate-acetate transporter protein
MATTADSPAVVAAPAIPIADPGPLGLSAFALTTFFLSSINAGLIPLGTRPIILGLTLFYGGAVQIVAGIWEFRKNNTFGATAFSSYGAFWMSYWAILTFGVPAMKAAKVSKEDIDKGLAFFLLGWTIFTLIMLVGSFRTNRALVVTFTVLTIAFILLFLSDYSGGNESLLKAGGWFGLAAAAAAWYTAAAGVLSETWKRPVLPVGKF